MSGIQQRYKTALVGCLESPVRQYLSSFNQEKNVSSYAESSQKVRSWLQQSFDRDGRCLIDAEDARYYYKTPYLMTMAGLRDWGARVAQLFSDDLNLTLRLSLFSHTCGTRCCISSKAVDGSTMVLACVVRDPAPSCALCSDGAVWVQCPAAAMLHDSSTASPSALPNDGWRSTRTPRSVAAAAGAPAARR